MKNKIILLTILFFFQSKLAFAYLDPGLGSYILNILAFVFASVIASISIFYEKIKIIFQNLKNKIQKKYRKN